MEPAPTIDAMNEALRTFAVGDVREKLRALQAVHHAADAAQARLLAELDASKEFELDGASTLNTWVRNELRMNAGAANVLVRNAIVLRDLPLAGEAALSGLISAAHVQAFVYGLKHVGLEPMRQHEELFVGLATEQEPAALLEAIKHLKNAVHPGDLDDAYERGMDKEDISIHALLDGCSAAATPYSAAAPL